MSRCCLLRQWVFGSNGCGALGLAGLANLAGARSRVTGTWLADARLDLVALFRSNVLLGNAENTVGSTIIPEMEDILRAGGRLVLVC